jgi:cytochrome c oxidase subunit 3
MIPLLVLAAIMAAVVWWLLWQTLDTKPWIEQRSIAGGDGEGAISLPTVKVGLGVFLIVVTSLFALFISAYFMRMHVGDWSSLPKPGLLWLNTGVLVLTSIAMQWTRGAAKRERIGAVRNGLIVAGALTVAFLVGQLLVWQQLIGLGYFAATNPANAFFYLFTALHGLHLLGGLVAWRKTTMKVWRGARARDVRLSVELCTVYWHYLLVVWLVLFGLLLST